MLKKTGKILLKSFLYIISFIILAMLVGYFTASYWLVPVVNKYVPEITQTPASLAEADLSLFSGRVSFKNIKIGNPEGFPKEDLFKVDEISVQFQPKSILTDKIIVDKILIKGSQILAELNQKGQVNLVELNQNVQNSLNQGQTNKTAISSKTTTNKAANNQKKSIIIKDLQILDTSVQVGFMGKKSTVKLPDIKEKNIGEKSKTSLADATMLILDKITLQPLDELQKSGQKALKNTLNYLSSKTGNSETFKLLQNSFSHLLK